MRRFLYDADCGFCMSCLRWLTRFAPRPKYQITAWQDVNLAELGLTAQQCAEAAWFIDSDGTRHSGSDAIARALQHGSWTLHPLGRALQLPGIRRLAQISYTWIAQNRHRLPGGTPQCRVR